MMAPTEDLVRVLAEQAYSLQLLIKALRDKGTLKEDPTEGKDPAEFEKFLREYRTHYFGGTV